MKLALALIFFFGAQGVMASAPGWIKPIQEIDAKVSCENNQPDFTKRLDIYFVVDRTVAVPVQRPAKNHSAFFADQKGSVLVAGPNDVAKIGSLVGSPLCQDADRWMNVKTKTQEGLLLKFEPLPSTCVSAGGRFMRHNRYTLVAQAEPEARPLPATWVNTDSYDSLSGCKNINN